MIRLNQQTHTFHLRGQGYSYLMRLQDGVLLHLYWGAALPDEAPVWLFPVPGEGASFDSGYSRLPCEVPTQERGYFGMRALNVINPAGDDVLSLRYVGHRVLPGKPALDGLPSSYAETPNEAETLEIDLRDALTGVAVTLRYTVFENFDVLARSLCVRNEGEAAFTLTDARTAVRLPRAQYDVLHLKGAWARERYPERTALTGGTFSVESRRGASGHENHPFLALLGPDAGETSGEVYAMTHVYSGSFRAAVDRGVDHAPLMSIGLNPDVFAWRLEPGEAFQAPEALLVYSAEGLGGMSHRWHAFLRKRVCRGVWRDRPRPVLINNWEATYFNFSTDKLLAIARRAAQVGCELFVLDDGWFGKRDNDDCSLGDWVVNTAKLPGGLKPLCDQIHSLGMMFGLWFEPEMVSPDSDLYRAHPDWCLHVEGRPRTEARNQLILDLAREEVQAYLIRAISDVLRSAPINYVKWDMNRNMAEGFSASLPLERRLESQHRYMRGLYRVLAAITEAFPEVLFESCSGGGGRFDCGMLCYMPQTWTSDDTDAYERTLIQYGTSMLYPSSAMGAHVSCVPNHQTGRITPFQTRCDVALGGCFGFELDFGKLSDDEMALSAACAENVKRLRPTLSQGTFSRLVNPFESHEQAAWQFVSAEGETALLCVFSYRAKPNPSPERVRMTGLDPAALYRCAETGAVCSGAALMHAGVPIRPARMDYYSQVIEFHREPNA